MAPDLGGKNGGNDFRAAYAPGVTLTGQGQELALVQFSGYYGDDILTYEASNSLPNVTVTTVSVDCYGYPLGPGYGCDEVTMDIESVIAMAPGLSEVIVYEGISAR